VPTVIVGETSAAYTPVVVMSDPNANAVKTRARNAMRHPRRYPVGYFMVNLEATG
jgi:hypothetical protein